MQNLGWIIAFAMSVLFVFYYYTGRGCESEIEFRKIFQDSLVVEYSLAMDKYYPIVIGFTREGRIKFLYNHALESKQRLVFHDNGFLAVKTTVDLLDRIQGREYYFHESNGNMSHNYNYLDDRRVGVSTSHHPNTHYLREYMEYDSLGRMYYRISFDTLGNKISEEGN